MTRTCPSCGRGNPARYPACFHCGAPLAESAAAAETLQRAFPWDPSGPRLDADGFALPPSDEVISITALAPEEEELIDDEEQLIDDEEPLVDDEAEVQIEDEEEERIEDRREDTFSPTPAPDEWQSGASTEESTDPGDPLSAALDRVSAAVDTLRGGGLTAEEGRKAAGELFAAAADIRRHYADPAGISPPGPSTLAGLSAPSALASRPVVLPPVRLAYALVIPGLNQPDRAPELVRALKVDGVTARQLAGSHYVCVAGRSAAAEPLQEAVRRLAETGIRAAVLGRDELLSLPHPIFVVSARSSEPMVGVAGGPLWEHEHEHSLSARGEALPEVLPVLAVLGEIVIVRARTAFERSRSAPLSSDLKRLDEHRVGVVDLWGPGMHLRFVEGMTRVDSAEARAPFRAFLESLPVRFPGVRVEARRICRPEERAAVNQPGETVAQTGWPTFDEHTRMVWRYYSAPGR